MKRSIFASRNYRDISIKNTGKMEEELKMLEETVASDYKYGFVTDIETDIIPKGLSEDVIRLISAKEK